MKDNEVRNILKDAKRLIDAKINNEAVRENDKNLVSELLDVTLQEVEDKEVSADSAQAAIAEQLKPVVSLYHAFRKNEEISEVDFKKVSETMNDIINQFDSFTNQKEADVPVKETEPAEEKSSEVPGVQEQEETTETKIAGEDFVSVLETLLDAQRDEKQVSQLTYKEKKMLEEIGRITLIKDGFFTGDMQAFEEWKSLVNQAVLESDHDYNFGWGKSTFLEKVMQQVKENGKIIPVEENKEQQSMPEERKKESAPQKESLSEKIAKKADSKKNATEVLVEQATDTMHRIFDNNEITAFFDTVAGITEQYFSLNNLLIIYKDFPNATFLENYNNYSAEYGRQVADSSKIKLIFPNYYTKSVDAAYKEISRYIKDRGVSRIGQYEFSLNRNGKFQVHKNKTFYANEWEAKELKVFLKKEVIGKEYAYPPFLPQTLWDVSQTKPKELNAGNGEKILDPNYNKLNVTVRGSLKEHTREEAYRLHAAMNSIGNSELENDRFAEIEQKEGIDNALLVSLRNASYLWLINKHKDWTQETLSTQALCLTYITAKRYNIDTSSLHLNLSEWKNGKEEQELKEFLNTSKTESYHFYTAMSREVDKMWEMEISLPEQTNREEAKNEEQSITEPVEEQQRKEEPEQSKDIPDEAEKNVVGESEEAMMLYGVEIEKESSVPEQEPEQYYAYFYDYQIKEAEQLQKEKGWKKIWASDTQGMNGSTYIVYREASDLPPFLQDYARQQEEIEAKVLAEQAGKEQIEEREEEEVPDFPEDNVILLNEEEPEHDDIFELLPITQEEWEEVTDTIYNPDIDLEYAIEVWNLINEETEEAIIQGDSGYIKGKMTFDIPFDELAVQMAEAGRNDKLNGNNPMAIGTETYKQITEKYPNIALSLMEGLCEAYNDGYKGKNSEFIERKEEQEEEITNVEESSFKIKYVVASCMERKELGTLEEFSDFEESVEAYNNLGDIKTGKGIYLRIDDNGNISELRYPFESGKEIVEAYTESSTVQEAYEKLKSFYDGCEKNAIDYWNKKNLEFSYSQAAEPNETIEIKIYQVNDGNLRDYAFYSYEQLTEDLKREIDKDNYDLVAMARLKQVKNYKTLPDSVFQMGNESDMLQKFTLPNMTLRKIATSDIIETKRFGQEKPDIYYVDYNGFKRLDSFESLNKAPVTEYDKFMEQYRVDPVVAITGVNEKITKEQAQIISTLNQKVLPLPKTNEEIKKYLEKGKELAKTISKKTRYATVVVNGSENEVLKEGDILTLAEANLKLAGLEKAINRARKEYGDDSYVGNDKIDITIYFKNNLKASDDSKVYAYHAKVYAGDGRQKDLLDFVQKDFVRWNERIDEILESGTKNGREITSEEILRYKNVKDNIKTCVPLFNKAVKEQFDLDSKSVESKKKVPKQQHNRTMTPQKAYR